MTHNFHDSNEKSLDAKMFPFWEKVYFELFGNDIEISKTIEDLEMQKKGIDRIITLKNGKKYLIDEKVRFTDYDDILLEYLSAKETGSKGWIEKDLTIDYILYAFNNKQVCYVLDYITLKRVWKYYGEQWKKKYKIVEAKNHFHSGIYTTVSVVIPTSVLLNVMKNASLIDLKLIKSPVH